MTLLTPDEVAELAQLHVTTVRRLCLDGTIPARKIGGVWRISPKRFEAWINEDAPPPTTLAEPSVSRRQRAIAGGKGKW
jgi:excisionase family DNA binding protein